MAKTIKEERLRWVLPIMQGEVKLKDVAQLCPHSKRSLERWVALFKAGGETALEPKSTRPKTHPKEIPIAVKEQIITFRKKKKVCALKLKWKLEKKGIKLHERTIGKILKREGLVRKYRVRRMTYKYLKAELKPGELVEIDVKYVPGKVANKQYFQYTAIDCASRWRCLKVYEDQGSNESLDFLKTIMERFPHKIQAIKTDNHASFTNWGVGVNKRSDRTVKTLHALDEFCAGHSIIHYLIDPGKPAQNGRVERSHREDQEKFYERKTFESKEELQRKMRRWNIRYNNLEHCGLNRKTPNEYLVEYKLTHPPNVRT